MDKRHPKMKNHIVIIGGGAAAAALTLALYRLHPATSRAFYLSIIEPRPEIGLGIAYGTTSPEHLLNVPSTSMSLFSDQANDFKNWLEKRYPENASAPFQPRLVYGQYITERLKETTSHDSTFQHIQDTAVFAQHTPDGWEVTLQSGDTVCATTLVLASGNASPMNPLAQFGINHHPHYIENPWDDCGVAHNDPDSTILFIGSGLTMVDHILSLNAQHHQGPFITVSRHGLLPQSYPPIPTPPDPQWHTSILAAATNGSLASRVSALHDLIQQSEGTLNWQTIIATLRADTPTLWQALSERHKAQFLRHLRPRWDSYRHRISAESEAQLTRMRREGQLVHTRGRITSVRLQADTFSVDITGPKALQHFTVNYIINCTGPYFPQRYRRSLEKSLIEQGDLTPDRLQLGFRSDQGGAAINAQGNAHPSLFLIGSARRADLWESTAMPEIRVQARELAYRLGRSASYLI